MMTAFDPITGVEQIGDDLIKHFFPDPGEQAAAKEKLTAMKQNGDLAVIAESANLKLAQIEVDKVEAEKPGLFGDWRDALGWTCTLSFFWDYVGLPLANYWLPIAGITLPPLIPLDMTTPQKLLLALLGLGGGALKLVERRLNAKKG